MLNMKITLWESDRQGLSLFRQSGSGQTDPRNDGWTKPLIELLCATKKRERDAQVRKRHFGEFMFTSGIYP